MQLKNYMFYTWISEAILPLKKVGANATFLKETYIFIQQGCFKFIK